MQAFQTTNTPNMLGIYLLGKAMNDALPIGEEAVLTEYKAKQLRDYFRNHASCKLLIEDEELASDTVIVVKSNVEGILKIKLNAKSNGLLLGNGYGQWAKDTFRIANFPAHTKADMDSLIHFFDNYL